MEISADCVPLVPPTSDGPSITARYILFVYGGNLTSLGQGFLTTYTSLSVFRVNEDRMSKREPSIVATSKRTERTISTLMVPKSPAPLCRAGASTDDLLEGSASKSSFTDDADKATESPIVGKNRKKIQVRSHSSTNLS